MKLKPQIQKDYDRFLPVGGIVEEEKKNEDQNEEQQDGEENNDEDGPEDNKNDEKVKISSDKKDENLTTE